MIINILILLLGSFNGVTRVIANNSYNHLARANETDLNKTVENESKILHHHENCGLVPIFEKAYKRSIELPLNDSKSKKDGDFRILHGLNAKPGEWPWIVQIKVCKPNSDCEVCTGTLINSRWIITAGHCVDAR